MKEGKLSYGLMSIFTSFGNQGTEKKKNDPHSKNKWGLVRLSKSDRKIKVAAVRRSSTLPFRASVKLRWHRAQMERGHRTFAVFVDDVTALVTTKPEDV